MNTLAQHLAHLAFAALVCGTLGAAAVGCRDTNVSTGTDAGSGGGPVGGGGGQPQPGGGGTAGAGTPPRDAGASSDADVTGDAAACSDTPNVSLALGAVGWDLTGVWPGNGQTGNHYEGWVVVERSTAHELVLGLPLTAADDDAGAVDAVSVGHCRVSSQRDLPGFSLGSRVWLLVSNDNDYSGIPRRHAGEQLSLRAAQHGALLLGMFASPEVTADALSVREPQELCSEPAQCFLDGRHRVYSLEVTADTPVRLSPGTHAEVSLADARYDVSLYSAARTTGSTVAACADTVQDDRLWVRADVLAVEPDKITARLDRGVLASCKLGNDPGVWIDHSVYEHGVSEVVESEVKYRGKLQNGTDELQFDIVGGVGALGIRGRNWPLPEPTAGQTFWLSSTYWYFVLRESQTGPVVLASGAFSELAGGVIDSASLQLVGQWLGTPLSVERDCVYEPARGGYNDPSAPSHLHRVRLGDAGGTSVASGTSARVGFGGAEYDVWVSTEGSYIPLTIQRAP